MIVFRKLRSFRDVRCLIHDEKSNIHYLVTDGVDALSAVSK